MPASVATFAAICGALVLQTSNVVSGPPAFIPACSSSFKVPANDLMTALA